MPSSFLTDDTVWRLVCARQLDELDPTNADSKEHEDLAGRIQADPQLGLMSATEAAKAFHAANRQPAA